MIHFIHNIMFFFFFCKFLIMAHFNIGYRGLDATEVCTHPQTHSYATSINPVCPSTCFRKRLKLIITHFLFIKIGFKENCTSEMKNLKNSYSKSPGRSVSGPVRGAGCGLRDLGALVLRTHVREEAMKGET